MSISRVKGLITVSYKCLQTSQINHTNIISDYV